MAATYTAGEYLYLALAVGLGGLLFIMILGIWAIRKIAVRCKNPAYPVAVLLIYVFAIILLFSWIFPVFDRTGDLLISGEYSVESTAGKIESISSANTGRFHLRNGALLGGAEFWVDGVCYYVMDEGLLTDGIYISFDYAHSEKNVVLNWQEVTPQMAAQLQMQQPPVVQEIPLQEPNPTVKPEMVTLGSWLCWIGFGCFLAVVFVGTMFPLKLTLYKLRRDAKVHGEIRPDLPFILMHLMPPLIFFSMIVIGASIAGNEKGMYLILVLGVGGMSAFIFLDATTHLKMDGSQIIIRRRGKDNAYFLEDVRAIFWRNIKGVTGKAMVLVLRDGKIYWFDMDSFVGVQSTFDLIHGYLEEAEKAEDC